MSKFLVTGGLGFIGHNVVQKLELKDHDVVIVDNQTNYGVIPQDEIDYLIEERLKKISTKKIYKTDITNFSEFNSIVEAHQPKVIVHLASFPRQKVVNANPAWGSRVMIEGLINVCESAKKNNVERVVYVSSSMVYGEFQDQVQEESACNPIGNYAIMKLAGENIIKDYHRRDEFDYIIIRPSAVYGPLDVEDRVVSKFMLAAMRDQTLHVNGQDEKLDFSYVDDVADGIVSAATRIRSRNLTYNITKSCSVKLHDAAKTIVGIVGKGNIECRDQDTDFPSRGSLNIDRARVILGYEPKISTEQGFQKYYEWLISSPYWQDKLQA